MEFKTTRYSTDDVAPGKYKATFIGCSDPVSMEHGQGIFWEFEIKQDSETWTVTGVTSISFALDPRCKARRWAEAIDPKFTPAVLGWNSEANEGRPCTVDVIYFEGPEGLRSTVKEVYKWVSQPSEPKSDAS